jgi:DNA-binding protein H-NS
MGVYSAINFQRGEIMERADSIIEWLEVDLTKLTDTDRVTLITEIMDTLPTTHLRTIRENADKRRNAKLNDARKQVVAEMKEKFEQLDLTFEEAVELSQTPKRKKRQSSPVKVKYQSPNGEAWSGRGRIPKWLRILEEEGHNREEYKVVA